MNGISEEIVVWYARFLMAVQRIRDKERDEIKRFLKDYQHNSPKSDES